MCSSCFQVVLARLGFDALQSQNAVNYSGVLRLGSLHVHDERASQSPRIFLVYSRGAGIRMGDVFIGCTSSDGLMIQCDRTLERKIGQTCYNIRTVCSTILAQLETLQPSTI